MGLRGEWPPQVHGLAMRRGVEIAADMLHAGRHDADNRESLAREQQGLADDAWVGLEMGAPETVTENDDVVVVLVLLFLVEVAAESGVMPEDAKIFVGDAHAGNVLGA